MITKEKAAEVRSQLKKLGITNKQVSVLSDCNGISCRVKDLTIPLDLVESIARKHEEIDYCEITQEILSGGNFFVSVSYTWEAESEAMKSPKYLAILERVTNCASQITDNSGVEYAPSVWIHKMCNNSLRITGIPNFEYKFHNVHSAAFDLYLHEIQN